MKSGRGFIRRKFSPENVIRPMEWTQEEDKDCTIARTFYDAIFSLDKVVWSHAAVAVRLPIRSWAKNMQHFHTFIINYSHQIYGVWIKILNTFTIHNSFLGICRPVRVYICIFIVHMYLSFC